MDHRKETLESLDYEIGDPIKNSVIIAAFVHRAQRPNILHTAQVLWHFKAHPEYLGYGGTTKERLFDLLGIEIDDPKELSDLLCDSTFAELVEDIVKPGILVDLIYAFRKKSADLPQLTSGRYVKKGYSSEKIALVENRSRNPMSNERALALYKSAVYLPSVEENWQLGHNALYYAPFLCDTPEKMREFYSKAFDFDETELKESVERGMMQVKRFESLGREILKDLSGKALALVEEFAPERYDRFSEAVART